MTGSRTDARDLGRRQRSAPEDDRRGRTVAADGHCSRRSHTARFTSATIRRRGRTHATRRPGRRKAAPGIDHDRAESARPAASTARHGRRRDGRRSPSAASTRDAPPPRQSRRRVDRVQLHRRQQQPPTIVHPAGRRSPSSMSRPPPQPVEFDEQSRPAARASAAANVEAPTPPTATVPAITPITRGIWLLAQADATWRAREQATGIQPGLPADGSSVDDSRLWTDAFRQRVPPSRAELGVRILIRWHPTRRTVVAHRGVLRPGQDDHRQVERARVRQTLLPERSAQPSRRAAQRLRTVRLRARRRRRGPDRTDARVPDGDVHGVGRRRRCATSCPRPCTRSSIRSSMTKRSN